MTIRRQWLVALVSIAIISVTVNSLIFSQLVDQYFVGYVTDDFENRVERIQEYSKKVLLSDDYEIQQIAVQLEAQLAEPILQIKLYDEEETLLADVKLRGSIGRGQGEMGRGQDGQLEQVDSIEIKDGVEVLGTLHIKRYSSIENTLSASKFQYSLFFNSMIAIAIAMILAVLAGLWISKKMSRELIDTADIAQGIDLGKEVVVKNSKVLEIRTIQQSLQQLQRKLKLRGKSRKTLVDSLVHQTRTPLTIMKTHLEGVEDKIINMTGDEIKIFHEQLDNITSIISNMSRMIDVSQDEEKLRIESFELSAMLKQVVNGLKPQFMRKNIKLIFDGSASMDMKTDHYLLSQVIYNLLTNSYKFTEPEGTVTLCTIDRDEEVMIVVEDTGSGIGKEDMEHIFEAYFRGEGSGRTPGEGIGLFVVRENILNLKGSIDVESNLGKGTKFKIVIPKSLEQNYIGV
ncbi:MAG: HAMP domain-containing sensor histidine kinase [Syntrophomonadaceae bacterium]|nr:HAMP domain-containing sensor histidine kinase [Syntrophomonadaceae bacterium]